MGRRSFISMTTINRLIAASNRAKREEYNKQLIREQGGNKKELSPTYSLNNVDFNPNTRNAKIEILKIQQYRTIERYITQNYVKYPIYSDWKTRTKTIKKTIKLTNQELESLNSNEDELIRLFADEIVDSLDNEELLPSWFIKNCLTLEYNDIINGLTLENKYFNSLQQENITTQTQQIKDQQVLIESNNKNLDKQTRIKNKLEIKLKKINNSKKSIFKSIFTLFLYNYFISDIRKNKLSTKLSTFQISIQNLKNDINSFQNKIDSCLKKIEQSEKLIQTKNQETEKLKQEELIKYNNKMSLVQPLQCGYDEDTSFIPLKLFNGFAYEKIIGCYIIRNKENSKYYVGQSKDIYRRIKQHFNGTIPKNIIFAEDYYKSQWDYKEDLFEIKIIPCNTKDELDYTERELIDAYDARNSGYNGTNGNT